MTHLPTFGGAPDAYNWVADGRMKDKTNDASTLGGGLQEKGTQKLNVSIDNNSLWLLQEELVCSLAATELPSNFTL